MSNGVQSGNDPSLSIVIPTYRRADDIGRLLTSLESYLDEVEVVVVDDGSPESSVFDPLKQRFPAVRFVHMEQNRGPGSARNRGAQECTSEIVLFLDSDTAMVPGSIEAVRRYFAENPEAHVCSGRYTEQPINSGFFPRYKALLESSWFPKEDCEVTFVGGRCFAVRRSAFREVDGFSTEYRGADVEDYDLGYRLRERFGRIWFLRGLVVQHRYPTAWQQAKLYYRRVILWMELRSGNERFDKVGTSQLEALISVLYALLPFVLVASIATGWLLSGLLFLALCIAVNSRFLGLCLRECGWVFAVRAVACHSFLAIPICMGAGVGILKMLLSRTSDPVPRAGA